MPDYPHHASPPAIPFLTPFFFDRHFPAFKSSPRSCDVPKQGIIEERLADSDENQLEWNRLEWNPAERDPLKRNPLEWEMGTANIAASQRPLSTTLFHPPPLNTAFRSCAQRIFHRAPFRLLPPSAAPTATRLVCTVRPLLKSRNRLSSAAEQHVVIRPNGPGPQLKIAPGFPGNSDASP